MKHKITPFFISVVAVICVTLTIIICTFSCRNNALKFKTTFYFICYSAEDNAISASSVSDAVVSYGGAGYILEYGNSYYVTVACYYTQKDAETVCKSLKNRNLDCEILEITSEEYPLNTTNAQNKSKLYLGNLNTLQSLSRLAYDCANKLDTGEYGQSSAKSVIEDIENTLSGLLKSNTDNCFYPHIKRLSAECADCKKGLIYSKDLRKLQIAVADVIINVKLT